MALLGGINGKDKPTHAKRRMRAKELLRKYREKIDFTWEARNIDFYGNLRIGEEKRDITKEEVKESLFLIEKMIEEADAILKEIKLQSE
jgi:hypothetical protein